MPNRNYVQGRAAEYRVKKEFEAAGYEVFRMAGSHGSADIIAVSPTGAVMFIQVKRTKTIAQALRVIETLKAKYKNAEPKLNRWAFVYCAEGRERFEAWL